MRLKADQDSFTCDYCGSVHVPEANEEGIRVFDEPSDLLCPICNTGLVHATATGLRILYCDRCHGMLISMGVFPAVVQDLKARRENTSYVPRPIEPSDLERRIRCPQCGTVMDTHVYGGGGNVVIDDCERCALNWLDHGELDRIVRAPDREYAS